MVCVSACGRLFQHVFSSFPQPLHTNAMKASHIIPRQLPSTSLPFHYSPVITPFDAIQSELLTVSLSTTRINKYNEQQMMEVLQTLGRGRHYDTNMTKCMGNFHLLSYNLWQSHEFVTMFNFWAMFPAQWVLRQCHHEGKLCVMG